MKIDAYACLVFSASWNAPDSPSAFGWITGPLPIPLPVTNTTSARGGTGRVTDRESRTTYFAPRVHNLLYGSLLSASESSPQRWYISQAHDLPNINGSRVEAWEILADGAGHCFAIAHIQLGSNAAASLSALTVIKRSRPRMAGDIPCWPCGTG
jgi:hypothetical protein